MLMMEFNDPGQRVTTMNHNIEFCAKTCQNGRVVKDLVGAERSRIILEKKSGTGHFLRNSLSNKKGLF
jgi:hypothetical protein